MTYAVVGATSWGLTLGWLLSRDGAAVDVVTRDAGEAARITTAGGLPRLPELTMPASMRAVPSESVSPVYEGVVIAVPARSLRESLEPVRIDRDCPIVCGTKGLEFHSLLRMSEVISNLGWRRVSVVSGPTLAHEVARGLPAAAVVASGEASDAARWQEALSGNTFRVYTSDDVAGVELAGALKNVVAIAAGAASGLGYGANAMAAIMTRGLAEMTRLGVALGASAATFSGLAGVGDLAATSFSPLSRNHRLGLLLAQGLSPRDALAAIGEAVEGAATARAAVALGVRYGVETPIADQVTAVLDGQASLQDAVSSLLSRSLKAESA